MSEPYSDSGSEYLESENVDSEDSDELLPDKKKMCRQVVPSSSSSSETDNEPMPLQHKPRVLASSCSSSETENEPGPSHHKPLINPVKANEWKEVSQDFTPRLAIPEKTTCIILSELNRGSSELQVFLKLFPNSLIKYISQCTNERLEILEQEKVKIKHRTDHHEIMITLGCFFVMAYNRVPAIKNYWSSNKSLGNDAIKMAISRDRFQLLASKLYFTSPKKPENAGKLYYIQDVVDCLKKTFLRARSESTRQAIDESMVKFKGRSVLKQYQPLKPIKRGVKIWERCDSMTGYVYDFDVYSGKEMERVEGTLGERVVKKLTSSVRDSGVSFCFDRFFTSVNLMNTLPFPAVGTCISSRKEMPNFNKRKRTRGEVEAKENNNGTIAFMWMDTKEVMIMSNCHNNNVVQISRKTKTGTKIDIPAPEAIEFYNAHMGGVDLSDQLTGLYEIDRKSQKWWRKVFYKLVLTAAVNSWIIFKELCHKPDLQFLTYLVNLAEQLIASGRQNASVVRKRSYGRSSLSSRNLTNVGDHLPVETGTRKRCRSCSIKKTEKRTKLVCSSCNIPLCIKCFPVYHT